MKKVFLVEGERIIQKTCVFSKVRHEKNIFNIFKMAAIPKWPPKENITWEVRENDHFFGIEDFDLKFSVHVHNTMLSEVSYSPMFYIMYIA